MAFLKSVHLTKILTSKGFFSKRFSTRILDITGTAVNLRHEGKTKELNNFWLRDNCTCPECFNHETKQKIMIPPKLPSEIRAIRADVKDSTLIIKWGDGHKSNYNVGELFKKLYPKPLPQKQLWDASSMSKDVLGSSTYDQIMSGDTSHLMNSLCTYGLGLIENVPATIEDTEKLCNSIVPIQHTIFGRFWSFTSDKSRADTAYTSDEIGVHTDTSYAINPMGIQIFHCLFHNGSGGETYLVDGFNAAEALRKDNEAHYQALMKYKVPHVYAGEMENELYAEHSILKEDCYGKIEAVRYNHYDRAQILNIPQSEIGIWYRAIKNLSKKMEDKQSVFKFKLTPGTVILVDNWRVLHGRNSFNGKRVMCGCYLSRDDWINLAKRSCSTL